jgi:hypothetical protein
LIVGGAFLLFPARHACGISRRHFSRKRLELISVQEAAPTKGVHPQILKASTASEIDAAFGTLDHLQARALLLVPCKSSPWR